MDYADGLAAARRRGARGRSASTSISGISSMQVDARERGFSYSYDAPLDMRMDPAPGARRARHRQRLGRAPAGAALPALRRGALRAPDRPRDRPAARNASRSRPPRSWWRRSRQHCRPPSGAGSAPGTPASACSRRFASRSTTSSSRSIAPCRWPGSCLRDGGRFAAISFHSLEDRRVKRFLADRARGCVCPPDFPICVCGHEPEAELLTGGAVVPTAGEVEHNPRAKSGRLRAARKLAAGEPG